MKGLGVESPGGLCSGLDRDALEQGDILRIPSLPITDKDPKTGAPGIAELDTPTGRGIVTTQTCDGVRETHHRAVGERRADPGRRCGGVGAIARTTPRVFILR